VKILARRIKIGRFSSQCLSAIFRRHYTNVLMNRTDFSGGSIS
jgi:hypothetical protein